MMARLKVIQSESEEVTRSDLEWDTLGAKARARRLRSELTTALAALEAGEASEDDLRRAESALSNLRAELYATPRGRLEHRALEKRLAAVTEAHQEVPQ